MKIKSKEELKDKDVIANAMSRPARTNSLIMTDYEIHMTSVVDLWAVHENIDQLRLIKRALSHFLQMVSKHCFRKMSIF